MITKKTIRKIRKSLTPKTKRELKEIITKSYKGNKWGRPLLKGVEERFELYEFIGLKDKNGKTMREISKEVYYWDKNNHKKFVSIGFVHKLLENKYPNEEDKIIWNLA